MNDVKMKWYFGAIFCFLLLGCKRELPYFNGEISYIDKFEKEINLIGKNINLDGIFTGYMSAYDSLLFFSSYKYQDYFMHVFALDRGKEIGALCQHGEGPSDFIGFTHTEQYVYDNGKLKLWVGDDFKQYCLLDVTTSLENKSTSIDSVIPFYWRNKWQHPLSVAFVMNNGGVLSRYQCQKLYYKDKDYLVTSYHLYYQNMDEEIKEYTLYNKPIIVKNDRKFDAPFELFLSSIDRLKPDQTKVVMGMQMIAQINILDVKTGQLRGFRIKDTFDFDYLTEDSQNYRMYYTDICADDYFIYALYANTLINGGENFPFLTNIIHVYDWNGIPICKVTLDKKVYQITVDPINNKIYGENNEEEVFQYDFSFFYE